MALEQKLNHTLFDSLDGTHQEFIRKIATEYRFTHQELRELCEIACDLRQWEESSLIDWWYSEECKRGGEHSREVKKQLLQSLHGWMDELRNAPTRYSDKPMPQPQKASLKYEDAETDKTIYGACPVYSEDTVCCNLQTIDAVENCGFGCNYCTIQSFYGDTVRFDKNFRTKLEGIPIDPERHYHIGTGQSSDSLMWGNRHGILDDLCAFARKHPNVLLEFKTKSDKVSYFLQDKAPPNIVLTWSLNTGIAIENEEPFTANLESRLRAARQVADQGIRIAFHFHPMIHYQGWERDYLALAERVQSEFDAREVLYISMGSVTFIKPAMRAIRERERPTKVLQMPLTAAPKGKWSYPDEIKVEMFQTLYAAFKSWHGQVFIYLCMEKADIWREVFGSVYASNEAFEADLFRHAMKKRASH